MSEKRNPEAEWEVRYLLKPEWQIERWRGMAPTREGAMQFAAMSLLDSGREPGSFSHMSTKRLN